MTKELHLNNGTWWPITEWDYEGDTVIATTDKGFIVSAPLTSVSHVIESKDEIGH